jgi:hypothetical protein
MVWKDCEKNKERKKEKGCARIGDATFSYDLINLVEHKGTHFATLCLLQIENDKVSSS